MDNITAAYILTVLTQVLKLFKLPKYYPLWGTRAKSMQYLVRDKGKATSCLSFCENYWSGIPSLLKSRDHYKTFVLGTRLETNVLSSLICTLSEHQQPAMLMLFWVVLVWPPLGSELGALVFFFHIHLMYVKK